MHRYRIVPRILLILSLINFLLAAPVVLQEVRRQVGDVDMAANVPEDVIPVSVLEKKSDDELLDKRWDELSGDEPKPRPQKRGLPSGSGSSPAAPSVGEPAPQAAADQELTPPNSPPSPQSQTGTTTSGTQDVATGSSPGINGLPPSTDEDHPPSGESYSNNHGGTLSDYFHASDEDGQALAGPSKSYSGSSLNTDILGVGSNGDGSQGSSKIFSPYNQPGELGGPWSTKSNPSSDGSPGSVLESLNEGRPGSSMNQPLSNRPEMMSTGPVPNSPPTWNLNDWSPTSSVAEPMPKKKFMGNTRKFFKKLIYKIKFWRRGPRVL